MVDRSGRRVVRCHYWIRTPFDRAMTIAADGRQFRALDAEQARSLEDAVPEYPVRRKIERHVGRLTFEHIIIFVDAGRTVALRHQVEVLTRNQRRPDLRPADRLLWSWLSRTWPDWRRHVVIVQPDTVVRWHRTAWRRYWRWKSRGGKRGRPRIEAELAALIRRMSRENPRGGADAPRPPPTPIRPPGRQNGRQRPRPSRGRGRLTGLLPYGSIAAVPATDREDGWADEGDEVADGRQGRPQHAAPHPRRDMPRRGDEPQAYAAGLSDVPRGGARRGQRGGLAGWGQRSSRSPVFQASQREGDESLPGALPRLGGCLSWVTSQSRSQPDPSGDSGCP